MPILRIQHSVQDISGLSKDRYVSSFYADTGPTVPSGAAEAAADAVRLFYTGANSGPPLNSFFASHASGPGSSVKVYNISGPPPHEPIFEETFATTNLASSTTNLPGEVAVCLSFQADSWPTVPIASRRGRIYFGPLNVDALDQDPGQSPSRPDNVLKGSLLGAAAALRADMIAAGLTWSVYSPTVRLRGGATYIFGVTQAWVDDAFDTQRPRGVAATAKAFATFP